MMGVFSIFVYIEGKNIHKDCLSGEKHTLNGEKRWWKKMKDEKKTLKNLSKPFDVQRKTALSAHMYVCVCLMAQSMW